MVAPMNTKFKLSHKQAQTRRDGEIYSQNHAHQVPEREGLDPDKGQLIVIHNLYAAGFFRHACFSWSRETCW